MVTRRILIIDDDETIQTVVQFGLRLAAGWEVAIASSGRQGLQMAQLEQPDAILLDLMMPDLDGMTIVQMLQSTPETMHLPIIVLTGKMHIAEISQLDQIGIRGVIKKPFNALDLPGQIAQMLNWSVSP